MSLFTISSRKVPDRIADNLPLLKHHHPDEINAMSVDFRIEDETIKCYVEPDGQSLNPADSQDDDTGLVSREPMLSMLGRYLGGKDQYTHAFILSDAGMGKTTLLTILKLAHLDQLVKDGLKVELLKIGPNLIDNLKKVANPASTILLLDALDEDRVAWNEFPSRVEEILTATAGFKKTVITCRTQFFPERYEKEGGKSGMVVLNGHHCSKLYLSPFSDDQVDEYLLKRFPHEGTRDKAKLIVSRMTSLKFRPMLLAYVDLLLDRSEPFERTFDLYKALVDEWFNRELRKGLVKQGDESALRNGCKVIADHMFSNKISRLDHMDLLTLVEQQADVAKLDEMKVEGRSLLHRTSEGGYKFAHQSMMEFFVTLSLVENPRPLQTSDQIRAFLTDLIDSGDLDRLEFLDLSGINVSQVKRRGLKATSAILENAHLEDSDLSHSVFKNADLRGTIWDGCDLRSANFLGSRLDHAKFDEANIGDILLSGLRSEGFQVVACEADKLKAAELSLHDFAMLGTIVRELDLADSSFSELTLDGIHGGNWTLKNLRCSKASITPSEVTSIDADGLEASETSVSGLASDSVVIAKSRFHRFQGESLKLQTVLLQSTDMRQAELTGGVYGDVTIDSGCQLDGTSWTEIRVEKATLEIAECAGLTISSSHLSALKWAAVVGRDWTVSATVVRDASCNRLRSQKSVITGLRLISSDLTDSQILSTQVDKSEFDAVNFRGATFRNSAISARFSGCNLDRAAFIDCQLSGCSFIGADLTTTRFERCRWQRCDLTEVTSSRIYFGECGDIRLTGASMPAASFAGRKVHRLVADRADLSAADFSGTTASDSDFRSTKLTQASMDDATFRGCDFRGADLSMARVPQTSFEQCTIDEHTHLPKDLTPEQRASLRLVNA